MNARQQRIMKYLLTNNNRFFSAEQLAEVFQCSEKTIRNDIEDIVYDLEEDYIDAGIYKTNKGIGIETTYQERQKVLHFLRMLKYTGANSGQLERDLGLIEKLFVDTRAHSVSELADSLYVSENTLRRQLQEFKSILAEHDLKLSTGKQGVQVCGRENDKFYFWNQNTFSYNYTLVKKRLRKYFSDGDLEKARTIVEAVEKTEGFRYTGAARMQLAYALLFFVMQVNSGRHYEADAMADTGVEKPKLEAFQSRMEALFGAPMHEGDYAFILSILLSANKCFDFGVDYRGRVTSPEIPEKAEQVISAVERAFRVNFRQDELFMQSLYAYLDDAVKRERVRVPIVSFYLSEIQSLYPDLFDTLRETLERENWFPGFTTTNLNYEISYLTLHFQAAIERAGRKRRKLKAVILNNMNPGITLLMNAKLTGKEAFDIVSVIQEDDMDKLAGVDFIITTVPLKDAGLPCVLVSPFILEEDELSIRHFLENNFKQ